MIKSFLYILSVLYRIVTIIRNWMYDVHICKSHDFDFPVISIGNLTVGGTGKTPHTEYLIRLLQKEFNIAVLSRGYKRKTRGFLLATLQSTAKEIGDEPRQIKQKFPRIDVAVDAKRVRGIKKLKEERKKLNIVLLDDAFQHRAVKPGISILLTDFNRPFYEDYHMPYGRLREQRSEMHRANIIIVTKTPPDASPMDRRVVIKKIKAYPSQAVFFSSIKYGNLIPLQQYSQQRIYEQNPEEVLGQKYKKIILITGIANPLPMYEYLVVFTKDITHFKYPDHYGFSKKDIEKLIKTYKESGDNTIIITTEKDAMRLGEIDRMQDEDIDLPMYSLPIEVEFSDEEKKTFNHQIISYVKTNKGFDAFFKQPLQS